MFLGVFQLFYIDSPAFNSWPYAIMIPIYSAIGWALFGMIAGCGGALAGLRFKRAERRFDTQMTDGRIVIAIEFDTRREVEHVAARLSAAGVTDLKLIGGHAA